MKKILVGLGVLVALLIVAALVAPMLIPKDTLEAQIETRASEALGRQVTIDGAPDISIFPRTSLQVRGLTVANAEGFDAPYLLQVGEANIGVKLLPLLSKRIEITRFDLDAPDIHLQATPEGEANWTLTQQTEAQEQGPLPDLRLGTVNINDGAISYDGGTGRTYAATDADITLKLPSLDDTLEADGTMTLEGRPASFEAEVTSPRSLAEQGAADIGLQAKVGENTVDAQVRLSEGLAFGGQLAVAVPQLRDLMALAGTEPPAGPGFERLALSGEVNGTPERVTFAEGTQLQFDAIEGTGNLTVDLSGERPAATGAVQTGVLDLRPYLPEAPAEEPAEGAGFPPWSEEPIDLSALRTADADLSFSADAIVLPTIRVGQSAARLTLENGLMTMRLERMGLYSGSGTGALTVNARGQTPTVAAQFNLSGVDAQQLATEVMNTSRLSGSGDVALDLTTAGNSQADFVRGLDGTVTASLANGAIQGVNLGKIGRAAFGVVDQLQGGGLNVANIASSLNTVATEARGPAEQTDFASLVVDLGIADGIATSRQIALDGPYYEVTGDGTVNLPEQSMRMTLQPSVAGPQSDTRRTLPAPILVSGTFSNPKIGVDAQPLAQAAASGALRNVLGGQGINLGEGETVREGVTNRARDEVGRILGRGRPATEDPDAQAPEEETDETEEEEEEEADPISRGLDSIFGGKGQ
ncbi:AsmA family protein [Parvularcula dongshanensis]|uniref:AsmA protein n=1 Tax=Parvularcula dongshanensis TaxID=1173995 RepID=A0A840I6D7_9PROT|nr:AsmA family protein [Parvularcula dongshanensis]MBB4659744.1 AsmA protein [Parvularcula dongshanensis]